MALSLRQSTDRHTPDRRHVHLPSTGPRRPVVTAHR